MYRRLSLIKSQPNKSYFVNSKELRGGLYKQRCHEKSILTVVQESPVQQRDELVVSPAQQRLSGINPYQKRIFESSCAGLTEVIIND